MVEAAMHAQWAVHAGSLTQLCNFLLLFRCALSSHINFPALRVFYVYSDSPVWQVTYTLFMLDFGLDQNKYLLSVGYKLNWNFASCGLCVVCESFGLWAILANNIGHELCMNKSHRLWAMFILFARSVSYLSAVLFLLVFDRGENYAERIGPVARSTREPGCIILHYQRGAEGT
jgi:hypothetical protein